MRWGLFWSFHSRMLSLLLNCFWLSMKTLVFRGIENPQKALALEEHCDNLYPWHSWFSSITTNFNYTVRFCGLCKQRECYFSKGIELIFCISSFGKERTEMVVLVFVFFFFLLLLFFVFLFFSFWFFGAGGYNRYNLWKLCRNEKLWNSNYTFFFFFFLPVTVLYIV